MDKTPRTPRDSRDETKAPAGGATTPPTPADERLLAALHARLDDEDGADEARELEAVISRDAEAARTAAAFERMSRLAAEARAEAPPFFATRVMARVAEARDAASAASAPAWFERLFGRRAGFLARLAPGLLVAALALWIAQVAVRPAVTPQDAPSPVAEAPGIEGGLDADDEGGAVPYRFEIAAPEAERVCLVGDFNGWTICEVPLVRDADRGTWSVQMELPPGRHEYMFVVDDGWVTDPAAPLTIDDGFGRRNAVIYL